MNEREWELMNEKMDGIAADVIEVKDDVKIVKTMVGKHEAIVATFVWLGKITLGVGIFAGSVAAVVMLFK